MDNQDGFSALSHSLYVYFRMDRLKLVQKRIIPEFSTTIFVILCLDSLLLPKICQKPTQKALDYLNCAKPRENLPSAGRPREKAILRDRAAK